MLTLTRQPTTYGALVRAGLDLLSNAGVANAAQDTRWLLERALGTTGLRLRVESDHPVSEEHRNLAWSLLARRASGEPLQYLLGTQEFCGLDFEVGPAVLIPRPETELLVQELTQLSERPANGNAPLVADIGTGSGCIAVALVHALPKAMVYATDLSAEALDIACRNAGRHGVTERVRFLEGDLLAPLAGLGLEGRLAAVVSNPPYIPAGDLSGLQREVRREPRLALDGGPDGLTLYRRLLHEAKPYLALGGTLALEVGQGQAGPVCRMAEESGGYESIQVRRDEAGIERVVCLQKSER
ncbi:MAG: peptide chain release factor N(5)-glutamine methyltransferase [Nitrospirae bacterium]|nr:MAG: peptide chain release factor N(5)-glutamine methyltransferase [Nitrospirota bacterium]